MGAGLREYAEAGSEDYAYQAGFGAQSGILAARLAVLPRRRRAVARPPRSPAARRRPPELSGVWRFAGLRRVAVRHSGREPRRPLRRGESVESMDRGIHRELPRARGVAARVAACRSRRRHRRFVPARTRKRDARSGASAAAATSRRRAGRLPRTARRAEGTAPPHRGVCGHRRAVGASPRRGRLERVGISGADQGARRRARTRLARAFRESPAGRRRDPGHRRREA